MVEIIRTALKAFQIWSDKLAFVIFGNSDVIFLREHVVFLQFAEANIVIFNNNLSFVFTEHIFLHSAYTGVSDEYACFFVVLDFVSHDTDIIIPD